MPTLIAAIACGVVFGRIQTIARNQGRPDPISWLIQETVSPISHPLSACADGMSEFFYGIFQARRLATQNAELRDRIAAMQLYQEKVDLLAQQIDDLRKQVALPVLPGHERVNLDVIGLAQPEGFLTLNGGQELGIKPNMPVVNGEGLVGIVDTVARGQCQVALVTTFGLKFGGIDVTRKPPERGLVAGLGASTVSMTMFDPKSSIASGDEVMTGGLSPTIPYGLLIGRVITVSEDPDLGTPKASIIPAVNLGTIREVQVIK